MATRSTSILIRVSPEEAETFKAAASRAGLGVGPWLRSLGMEASAGDAALRDAVALLDVWDRNAEIVRGAMRRAGLGGALPLPGDTGYDAKAKRIRAAAGEARTIRAGPGTGRARKGTGRT